MATIQIDLSSELPKAIAWTQAIAKQLPYATSQALNDMAYKVRDATRAEMPSRFTIRRDWTIRQVDVLSKSTKTDLSVTVGPTPYASYFLGNQELGGLKLPKGSWVAIPTKLVKRTKTDLIAASDKPKALIAADKVFVEDYNGHKWLALKGVKGSKLRGSNASLRFLYLLEHEAKIKPRLGLHQIGLPIVQRDFKSTIATRLEQAVASAR
jgi:hypothetical protein